MNSRIEEKIFPEKKSLTKIKKFQKGANEDNYNIKNFLNLKGLSKINTKYEKEKRVQSNNKNIFITIKILLLMTLYMNVLPGGKLLFILNHLSSIQLRIPGIGSKQIFNFDTYNFKKIDYPDAIYINGIPKRVNYSHYLNETDNFVILIWNSNINDCHSMFSGCSQITEIDLSNFNSSEITSISSMFEGCTKLQYINFTNFGTSKVINMADTFMHCWKLVSIDLSGFDTSKVENMKYMFYSCSSLVSLNVSSFNTSKIDDIDPCFLVVQA